MSLKLFSEEYDFSAVKVPTDSFFWSCRRKAIFDSCPFAAYLHYYASWNGWRDDSADALKSLYLQKQLKKIDLVVKTVFLDELKKIVFQFIAKNEIVASGDLLKLKCRSKLKYLLNNAVDPAAVVADPKRFALFDLFYCVKNFSELESEALRSLDMLCEKFCASVFFRDLGQMKVGRLKILPLPDFFYYKNIKIWTAPDLVWEEKGIFQVLNFYHKRNAIFNLKNLTNYFTGLYLRKKFPDLRKKIIFYDFFYEEENLFDVCSFAELNALEALNEFQISVGEMRQLENGRMVFAKDFPKYGDLEPLICSNCRFQSFCSE